MTFLLRIVEDNAERVALTTPKPTDAVPHVDAINATRAVNGTIMNGEGHGISLTQGNNLGARLHSRPLLGHHEFPTLEISLRFG
jgi:hypothetical protein